MSAVAKKRTKMEWWEVLEALGSTPQEYGVRRINLVGPPGTGKSTAPYRLYGQCEQAHLTEDSDDTTLIGTYALKDGTTSFVDGPATRAFRAGRPLVLEEIDRGSASVQSILHAVLDDAEIACVNLPSGERVVPRTGYVAIATMNGRPQDLDEPIIDRFDLVLMCTTPHPGILASLTQPLAAAVSAHYASLKVPEWANVPSARSALAFQRLSKPLGESVAASLVWGTKARDMAAAIVVA